MYQLMISNEIRYMSEEKSIKVIWKFLDMIFDSHIRCDQIYVEEEFDQSYMSISRRTS